MSSIWQTSFEKLQQPHLKEVFKALERGFEATSIDFYLIGALARDIWMTGIHDVPQIRRTRDIDFAVLISAREEFEQL
jgi:predicted nucleotidyltransferase